MAADERVLRFVEEALRREVPRAEIEQALVAAGWRREEVTEGLAAFAESPFPIPVPRPRPYLSAREAFLYLVLFTALYLSAYQLVSLLFELIETAWPSALTDRVYRYGTDRTIRWAISSLAVAFPLFLALSIGLERAARRDPARRGSRVRKWLTYLTLYVTATVLVGSLVTVLFRLLGGELTSHFVAKTAVVAGIATAVFVYYLGDLRAEETAGEERARTRRRAPWAWGATVAILAATIAGAFQLTPPAEKRRERLDDLRLAALKTIAGQVDQYARRHGTLPPDLETLAAEPWAATIDRDPETGAPYELESRGDKRYALCATFARSNPTGEVTSSFWLHPAGRHCYELEVEEKTGTQD